MSTTSGPVLPCSTGKSSVLPSGSLSVAVLSAMVFSLSGAESRYGFREAGIVLVAAACNDVPQVVVRHVEKRVQRRIVRILDQISLKNQVELQQAPAALPVEAVPGHRIHH